LQATFGFPSGRALIAPSLTKRFGSGVGFGPGRVIQHLRHVSFRPLLKRFAEKTLLSYLSRRCKKHQPKTNVDYQEATTKQEHLNTCDQSSYG